MIFLLYEDCFDTKNMSDLRKSERNNMLKVISDIPPSLSSQHGPLADYCKMLSKDKLGN